MGETKRPHGRLSGRQADRRTRYRIAVWNLGGAAILQTDAQPQQALMGRLVDVSAGGCCLLVARRMASTLEPGDDCMVTLPATKHGLQQPATLVDVESRAEAADDVLLRMRFRAADPLTQQRLARWIGELGVQSWHARSSQ